MSDVDILKLEVQDYRREQSLGKDFVPIIDPSGLTFIVDNPVANR
jgi:hypothetical protein